MAIFGLSIYVLIAVFFAIHALRNGKQLFWLFILFSFPFLGSVVYFFIEYLPSSRIPGGVSKATSLASKALDPAREVREARKDFDLTPTAQNQMRLAKALLEVGQTAEAVAQFDACLAGPFAKDPDIGFHAANAKILNGQPGEARVLLQAIRERNPEFRPEAVSLLLARAWAGEGNREAAKAEFEDASQRYGGVDVRAQYAIFAASTGDLQTARRLQAELQEAWSHWSGHTRSLNRPLIKSVEVAIDNAGS